jgi:hypothetical protein
VVDSLKALDPEWPIREADIDRRSRHVRLVPILLQKPAIKAASRRLHFSERFSPSARCRAVTLGR